MTWRGTMAEWLRDGPRLVREGVSAVEFTDHRPFEWDGCWFWCLNRGRNLDYELPAPIWGEMGHGEIPEEWEHESRGVFDWRGGMEEALRALSKAAIKWAREQKGGNG